MPLRVFQGQASYYADSLAGRKTASGQPYQPANYTGAHRELPFGTVVRVTCLDSQRTVFLTINDRGPFGSKTRVIDLSRAAAEKLGMIQRGVVKVRVEVVTLGGK